MQLASLRSDVVALQKIMWSLSQNYAWKMKVEQFNTIGTVLLGRKNYQGFGGYWPTVVNNPASTETDIKFSHWLDEIPKIVFSKTLEKAEWNNSRLVTGDLIEEVAKLKQGSGKDILIMSSASIAQECMKHDLIDEYWLNIHPVTLGKGLPLFKERVTLKLLNSRTFDSGQVFLHYATQRG
jgi:dihydrofolate reductase